MPTADARIVTDRPSRYLTQLCQHIGHLGDRNRLHRPENVLPSIVESSDTLAIVDFAPWGRCTMRAEQSLLTLHLDTTSEYNLQQLQDILTRNLTRFGRRDHLEVTWDRPTRTRRWPVLSVIILAKAAIVGLIVVLPSGLALSLGAGHAVILGLLLVAAAVAAVIYKVRGTPPPAALTRLIHRRHR